MLSTDKWTEKHWKANYELIRRGSFKHLWHKGQVRYFADVLARADKPKYAALYCSRQWGKTFGVAIYAIQHCLAKPKQIVRHIFPTQKLAKEVMFSKFNEILEILPQELKPQFRRADAEWVFPNGSVYKLGGADPQGADSNRGNYSTLIILDEGAFFDAGVFNYLVFSVLLPQTTHYPDAQIVAVTTPPENIAHPFITDFVPLARRENSFSSATIYDNPMLSAEQIQGLMDACGGAHTNAWRREYLAEIVADDSKRVVPEYDQTRHFKDYDLPVHGIAFEPVQFWGCVTADYGVSTRDFCAVTATVYDFVNNKMVIVAEDMRRGTGLSDLAGVVKTFEKALQEDFNCSNVDTVIDIHGQAGLELRNVYGLTYRSPSKVKIVDMLASFRSAVEHDKVVVTTDCPKLNLTLATGLWRSTAVSEQFSRTDALGHLDLIAAVVYTFRAVPWGTNSTQGNNKEQSWLRKDLPKREYSNVKKSESATGDTVRASSIVGNRRNRG